MTRAKKRIKYDLAPHGKPEPSGGLQTLILDLASGRKKPSNEKERELLKEIKEIEAKGGMLDLPLE